MRVASPRVAEFPLPSRCRWDEDVYPRSTLVHTARLESRAAAHRQQVADAAALGGDGQEVAAAGYELATNCRFCEKLD